MSSENSTRLSRILTGLARAIYKHPRWFIYPQFLLFAFSVVVTVNYLQFSTSRNDLVGADKKYHERFLQFKKEFPTQDDLVVVVESENQEKNRQFVERLGAKLEAETNLFEDVFFKGDLKMLGHKALLFVPEEQLKELRKTLGEYRPFIEQFTQATNLVSLFGLINRQFLNAAQQTNHDDLSMVKALPALERIIRQATESLERPGTPPAPGINALFGAGDEAEREMYITFAQGRLYIVTARAKNEKLNHEGVERLRVLVSETRREIPGVNVGITGEPVLEVDEMDQSQFDSTVASVVSLILCALIFVYGYRQTGRPLKATLCLLIGIGYTMGFTTLAVGHLNILTITFVPILVGLAIDFGVHLITRYEEELRHGRSTEEALTKAVVNTGMGIFTGAFTTAGAFFAMAGTDFKGIQEMGIICGGGILLCLVPMMTMLPAMLLKGRQNVIDHKGSASAVDRRARIENAWLQRPRLVSVLILVCCAVAGWYARQVIFDYNLLNMQSKGLPAVVFEKKLINSASKSVLFGAVIATNLEHAVSLEARIKKLPIVSGIDSMSQYLSQNQESKLQLVKEIKVDIESVHFADRDHSPIPLPELSRTLWALEGYLGLGSQMAEKDEPEIARQLRSLRSAISEFRKQMLRGHDFIPERLKKFEDALFTDIRETFGTLKNQDTSSSLKVEDLPSALRNRFIGVTGKYLLQVYPVGNVWQREEQEQFVTGLRQALDPQDLGDPIITGTPVQLLEYTTLLRKSYEEAAVYALIAVAILVFIHFRSISCVLLSLVPVAIGFLWMMGMMGYYNIPFNPANIMTLPLVIGIGVTNGIHILNRFSEERTPGILAKSTGKAVLVSGLTTIAGFGSLILGKHQGIASLGFVMAVGVSTCMIAALTFLPALINLLLEWGWQIKKPSVNPDESSLGSEEPR